MKWEQAQHSLHQLSKLHWLSCSVYIVIAPHFPCDSCFNIYFTLQQGSLLSTVPIMTLFTLLTCSLLLSVLFDTTTALPNPHARFGVAPRVPAAEMGRKRSGRFIFGGGCSHAGWFCGGDGKCCSGICARGLCTSCQHRGTACDRDRECCSGNCVRGLCQNCQPNTAVCDRDSECCSKNCSSVNRCVKCSAKGNRVDAAWRCCSGSYDGRYCNWVYVTANQSDEYLLKYIYIIILPKQKILLCSTFLT